MSAAPQTFFEDTAVDERVDTPAITLTEAHVNLYRGLAGEPMEDPTRVPDLLPIALSTGLGWRLPRAPLAVTAFLSLEWEILEPLRVGDTIRSSSRTATRRGMREGGLVVEEHEILDHRDRIVQRGRFTFLVAKRPGPRTGKKKESP